MAILFKAEHVSMILRGDPRWKTQTRRLGRQRWTVGTPQWAKRGFTVDSRFARVMIVGVNLKGRLGDLTIEDVNAEGYAHRDDYFEVYERIYGEADMDIVPWVVDFKVEDHYQISLV